MAATRPLKARVGMVPGLGFRILGFRAGFGVCASEGSMIEDLGFGTWRLVFRVSPFLNLPSRSIQVSSLFTWGYYDIQYRVRLYPPFGV